MSADYALAFHWANRWQAEAERAEAAERERDKYRAEAHLLNHERDAAERRIAEFEAALSDAANAIHGAMCDRPTVHSEHVWIALVRARDAARAVLGVQQ